MMNENMEEIVFLALIAERKQRDAILTALLEADVSLVNTIYGRGTVNANYLMNTLGLITEQKKVVIACVTTEKKAAIVFQMLIDKFHFNKPNTGVAFTIPVDGLSF